MFLALVYAVQRFWFVRAWTWIAALASPAWRIGLHVALIIFSLALVAALLDPLLGRAVSRLPFGRNLITLASLWLVASFFGFLAVQSVGGIEYITNLIARLRPGAVAGSFSPGRRAFFQYAAIFAGSAPFLAATYGFAAGRLRYTIERVDVPIANLPPELDGLRIAQLSDIHIGDYMSPTEIARAVGMANDLNPDIAFITGDFVSRVGDPLETCITELSRLQAPLGVYGCNGNHEIYAGVEDDAQRPSVGQQAPFVIDRLGERAFVVRAGVAAARLGEALDQRLVLGVEEDEPHARSRRLQRLDRGAEAVVLVGGRGGPADAAGAQPRHDARKGYADQHSPRLCVHCATIRPPAPTDILGG
mgnify:CR=1 FL=1